MSSGRRMPVLGCPLARQLLAENEGPPGGCFAECIGCILGFWLLERAPSWHVPGFLMVSTAFLSFPLIVMIAAVT